MANHADGTLFTGSFVLMPIAAGAGAIAVGAPWFTVPFAAAGFLFGLGIVNVGRVVTYSILGFGLRVVTPMKPWAQEFLGMLFLVLYMILPYAFVWAGMCGAFLGAGWSGRYVASYLSGWAEIAVGIFSSVASIAAVVRLYRATDGLARLIWDVNLSVPELDDEQEIDPYQKHPPLVIPIAVGGVLGWIFGQADLPPADDSAVVELLGVVVFWGVVFGLPAGIYLAIRDAWRMDGLRPLYGLLAAVLFVTPFLGAALFVGVVPRWTETASRWVGLEGNIWVRQSVGLVLGAAGGLAAGYAGRAASWLSAKAGGQNAAGDANTDEPLKKFDKQNWHPPDCY
jgi:hypothetical protein